MNKKSVTCDLLCTSRKKKITALRIVFCNVKSHFDILKVFQKAVNCLVARESRLESDPVH